ncbi:MAG: hypothetical protein PVH63_09815 [Balneolaceae bacterium]|jgi:hypothetical protein
MKKQYLIIAIWILVGSIIASEGWAQKSVSGEFNKLKKLEGDWKGLQPDGKRVEVNYKVMSNGSVVVETLMPENEPSMVTVYHMDGNKLMMTHYCSAGNQPRMVAKAMESEIDFRFVDATNLENKSEGHMTGLKFIFIDDNHFNQVWTWSENGKGKPGTFEFERAI